MRKFLIRRFLLMIPLIVGISILSFSIMKLAPGDPATLNVNLSAKIDPGYITKLREAYGLNDPVWVQYTRWLTRGIGEGVSQELNAILQPSEQHNWWFSGHRQSSCRCNAQRAK